MEKVEKTVMYVIMVIILTMSFTACGNNIDNSTTTVESANDNAQDM